MDNSLKQLRYLQKEIDLLKDRLKELENMVVTDVVTMSWPNFPYIEQRVKVSGVQCSTANAIVRLKKRLSSRIAELAGEQEKWLCWINSIPDSEIRQILLLRYLDGLSWQDVAHKLGTAGDGSTERKKVNRFLQDAS